MSRTSIKICSSTSSTQCESIEMGFTAQETLRLFLEAAFACNSAVVAMKETLFCILSPKEIVIMRFHQ